MCHQAGQTKSARFLLRFRPRDWNALHRDVFGDLVFPLQVVVGLDEYGTDYTGGEFLPSRAAPPGSVPGHLRRPEAGARPDLHHQGPPGRSARGTSAAGRATASAPSAPAVGTP